MVKIRKIKYGDKEIEYDADAPCIICGEPVIGASMGGTVICGACDCGKCRYCGMTIMVLRESIDNGESKRALLDHMKWHHEHSPNIVERTNKGLSSFLDKLDARLG